MITSLIVWYSTAGVDSSSADRSIVAPQVPQKSDLHTDMHHTGMPHRHHLTQHKLNARDDIEMMFERSIGWDDLE